MQQLCSWYQQLCPAPAALLIPLLRCNLGIFTTFELGKDEWRIPARAQRMRHLRGRRCAIPDEILSESFSVQGDEKYETHIHASRIVTDVSDGGGVGAEVDGPETVACDGREGGESGTHHARADHQ